MSACLQTQCLSLTRLGVAPFHLLHLSGLKLSLFFSVCTSLVFTSQLSHRQIAFKTCVMGFTLSYFLALFSKISDQLTTIKLLCARMGAHSLVVNSFLRQVTYHFCTTSAASCHRLVLDIPFEHYSAESLLRLLKAITLLSSRPSLPFLPWMKELFSWNYIRSMNAIDILLFKNARCMHSL